MPCTIAAAQDLSDTVTTSQPLDSTISGRTRSKIKRGQSRITSHWQPTPVYFSLDHSPSIPITAYLVTYVVPLIRFLSLLAFASSQIIYSKPYKECAVSPRNII